MVQPSSGGGPKDVKNAEREVQFNFGDEFQAEFRVPARLWSAVLMSLKQAPYASM